MGKRESPKADVGKIITDLSHEYGVKRLKYEEVVN